MPEVPVEGKGDFMVAGGFDLGLGRYRVDWMMRDARQRACSSHWDLEAKLGHSDRDLPLTLGPNMVADWGEDASSDSLQAKRDLAQPLRLKILLNLSPAKPEQSFLTPDDVMVLFSMVRSITH